LTMEQFHTLAPAVAWLEAQRSTQQKNINAMRVLMDFLGNPQEALRFVHVAGTNGKGSVCAMAESALRQSGLKTGLFTSPYLEVFNERIRINAESIPDKTLLHYINKMHAAVQEMNRRGLESPGSFFLLVNAIAFQYFADSHCDIVVLETGMGGRMDSTNIVLPEVSVITSIAIDHTRFLGQDVAHIAAEKAGIIKDEVPVVIAPQPFPEAEAVLLTKAKEAGAPVTRVSDALVYPNRRSLDMMYQGKTFNDIPVPLPGAHQFQNTAAAWLALQALKHKGWPLEDSVLKLGLSYTRWPGRLQWVDAQPPILLDGAHNVAGAQALRDYLEDEMLPPVTLVCAMMQDKDTEAMAATLAPTAGQVFCPALPEGRSENATVLADVFTRHGAQAMAVESLENALEAALSLNETVVVAGSLHLVGAALAWLRCRNSL
jgi:dihydrofolate synthase/folylpolyglutamate synthase